MAGAGDLYVTCLGGRNGRFGRLVGAGATPEQALVVIGSTVEGIANTRAALGLASKLMIDLPTARTVDILLREEIAGEEGFQRLLALFAMALSSSIAAPST